MLELALRENTERGNPPLPEAVVRSKVNSAMRYPAGSSLETTKTTEGGEIFIPSRVDDIVLGRQAEIELTGRLIWVERLGWHTWDGKRWKAEVSDIAADAMMQRIIKGWEQQIRILATAESAAGHEGRKRELDDVARRIDGYSAIGKRTAVLQTAKAWGLAKEAKDMDAHPTLLNCLNGVIDLDAKTVFPHDPDFYMTKLANSEYDPEADCPQFNEFVSEVSNGDTDIAAYHQRILGYSLTGNKRDDFLTVWIGRKTRNGKSTFANTIKAALGDYATSAAPETFARQATRNGGGPSEDRVRLRGARIIFVPECSKGMELDAAFVKTFTGGDPIPCRNLHQGTIEYIPQGLLVFHTNHLMRIDDLTLFKSSRMVSIPFEREFTGDAQDNTLEEQLTTPAVRNAVLRWMVDGYEQYKTHGGRRNVPEAVTKETHHYEDQSDTFGSFLSDCTDECSGGVLNAAKLYQEYRNWCDDGGFKGVMSLRSFTSEMRERGFDTRHTMYGNSFDGLMLKSDLPDSWDTKGA